MAFVRLWVTLVTLPPTLAHELVHAAAAAPVADEIAIVVRPRDPHAEAAWWYDDDADVSRLVERGIYLVPHIGGVVLAGVVGVLLVSGGLALPADLYGQLTWAILGVWWLVFTAPSAADLRGGQDGD